DRPNPARIPCADGERQGRSDTLARISPGHPRLLAGACMQPIQGRSVWAHKLDLGLRGFWRVLAGHIGHARPANRMIYWLRRSSPICLSQSSAIIPRPDEISGLGPGKLGMTK